MVRLFFSKDLEVLIEAAGRPQAGDISDLHAKCFGRHWGAAEIGRLLALDNVICLLAIQVGKPNAAPLGYCMVRHAADEAEILSIGVQPKRRRGGLAAKMIDESIRRLQGERVTKLFLEVDIDNRNAVSLYRKFKFETLAERPAYYNNSAGGKSAALVMRLDLD